MGSKRYGTLMTLLVVLAGACSSSSSEPAASGGASGSTSGGASGGTSQSASAVGGASKASSGGQSALGDSSSQGVAATTGSGGTASGMGGKGGTSASSTGGTSKAGSSEGGAGGTEKTSPDAGVPDASKGGTGGRNSTGGTTTGGSTNSGGSTSASTATPDAGPKDTSAPEGGTGGGGGAFDPCPATGSCKILPLGDSITWGVNYDGGYRVKLFTSATADKKNITYVGKLTNGPASIPQQNEGHSGWTIQQIDDIVTGKSNDANYKGKKLMVDLAPNIVLMHLGTNDTSRSPTGMPDRLGTLIDHILEDGPNVLLVVSTIIPIKQGSYGTVGETFNNAVPGVVQKRIDAGKHVILVDMFKSFPSGGLSGDGVHPNQQGYDWMAGVWYGAIKSYLH